MPLSSATVGSTGSAAVSTSAKESVLAKVWNWIKSDVKIVETGVQDLIGSKAAAAIETAGKELLDSAGGPLVAAALADATNVVTGELSLGAAVSSLIGMAEKAGVALSKEAATQLIALGQNALPAKPSTVTIVP